MKKKGIYAAVIFFLAFSSAQSMAAGRHLYWDQITVKAFLDKNGTLKIEEQQVFVFNGDWNGGERIFKISPGEIFRFISLKKRDLRTGKDTLLIEGDLDRIDHFKWKDSNTLRWRSRLPDDPLFNETRLLYNIEYSYGNVLKKNGANYVLDFNFLFTDREGTVKKFILYLRLDESWICSRGNSLIETEQNIRPGYGYFIKLDLKYSGTGTPPARSTLPESAKSIAFFVSLLLFLFFVAASIRSDASRGLFNIIPEHRSLDEKFLKEKLFYLLPEEVGAIWDTKIGAPEVAAILARLVSEKKLASELIPNPENSFFKKKKILQLKMLVPRSSFTGYEKKLINGLFVGGREITNTYEVKNYYKERTIYFNPETEIEPGLLVKVKKYERFKDKKIKAKTYLPSLLFLLIFAFSVAYSSLMWGLPYNEYLLPTIIFQLCFCFIPSFTLTSLNSNSFQGVTRKIFILLVITGGFHFTMLYILIHSFSNDLYAFQLISMCSLTLCLSHLGTAISRTDNSPEKIEFRRELAAIRNYFKKELGRNNPSLKDEWFPYLVAFGLAGKLDWWGRKYGKASSSGIHSGGISSSSSGGYNWSGGGGLFGGAGATGAWIAATGSMASASSSSSSGGGGGGSSGGGGGGGW